MAPTSTPPALQQALVNSTQAWQDHLQALFDHAKDWFPDVVWEVLNEDQPGADVDEVWGHKGIIYARAPPGFQARYFQFRPAPITSPLPFSVSSTPIPAQSAYSLSLGLDFPSRSPSPSPFRGASPAPSTNTAGPLRLIASVNSALFSNELEYLYTGKGLGEAFEFLFDTLEGRAVSTATEDGEETRVDKLRKDLVFMWRSRLYSDVRIALDGNFTSTNHEAATAVFSSHRFMLVARSPYFYAQFLSWGMPPPKPGEQLTVSLPGPPFTPASLHFTLGYIYTGTLVFSHRTYDLDTAFAIMRSATYLSIDSLYDDIQARIVQEMLHGLFHAFLEFSEYERVTSGKWGAGGCRCRQCARRAPRVLEFAVAEDVKNPHLERGARRALVGLFGEGWCTPEFAQLPQKTRDGLLKGLAKRTTPQNAFALLFAANHALEKIENNVEEWAEVARELLVAARKTIDRVFCDEAEGCFEQMEWLDIMETDGGRFEDGERVTWIMDAVRRGLADNNAAMVYQILVSSILLRSHPTERDQTVLSATSPIRALVETTRMEVIRWLRKRWLGTRQENGFEPLEDWALKEISHEIDVPVEELLVPGNPLSKSAMQSSPGGLRVANKTEENDSVSMHSTRAPSNTRSTRQNGSATRLVSDTASVRSVARSTMSTASRNNVPSPRRKVLDPRPDSKLTPTSSTSSLAPSFRSATDRQSTLNSRSSTTSSRRPPPPPIVAESSTSTPRSSAASMHSVRSRASTIRKSSANSSSAVRPTSNVSTTSDASTAFKTASEASEPAADTAADPPVPASAPGTKVAASPVPVRVRTSSLSTTSTRSLRSERPPPLPSQSVPSTPNVASSQSSVASSVRSKRTTPSRLTPSTAETTIKRGLSVQRSVSSASNNSTRSNLSMRSTMSTASSAAKKAPPRKSSADARSPPAKPTPATARTTRTSAASTVSTSKGKGKAVAPPEPAPIVELLPALTGMDVDVAEPTVKRKSSADTIREPRQITPPSLDDALAPYGPDGITLDIGIPCIISSKRAKFRALARYIGEVAGERGPWVGVEVPVGDSWSDDRLEGRQWHDGSWGGIRYFDLGARSEFDLDPRRRRLDSGVAPGARALKREGDQLSVDRAKRFRSESPAVSDASMSESRGLFVRPQQVLYVVDAVGSDF